MKVATSISVAAILAAGAIADVSVAAAQTTARPVDIPDVVVSTTPVPGSIGIDANKVPATLSTVTSADFGERANYAPSVTQGITQHVPGAISINVDGSDLSPDLFYRGFDVSRISGTAQGLAVYQNGVRINEAFGDSVNLDLLPPIAIDRADVYTNNPIFGLNALGGAIAFTLKNGFTFHGGDATVLGGSYGRVNGFMEYGKEAGNFSMYFAADGYRDGGYRPFGAQNAERAYVDLGYRSQDSEIHAIGSFGRSLLGVQGVTPQVLVNQQYNSVFTTPQTTNNQAGLAQLTGRFDVSPHWSIASNFYIRQFDQFHVDGNDSDVERCGGGGALANFACVDDDDFPNATAAQRLLLGANGQPFAAIRGFPYGSTAYTATHTTTFGTQQQATNTDKIFGHDNYFVVGASVDTSSTNFSERTTLGELNSSFQNIESGFVGAGNLLSTAGQIGYVPVFTHSSATYTGVFALDTFNVTKQLALTAGARFNLANIAVQDLTGVQGALNSSSSYSRINPVVGLTYNFTPAFTIYGGYSEANRAPTPLESECADRNRPCTLETALVSDPPLQQVVSHTFEGGARGIYALPGEQGTIAYKAGYFHTTTTNDIVSEPSVTTGQGFFVNAPGELRQGVELGLLYDRGPLHFYGNYAYVDATYQFSAAFASPNNPFANADGNTFVNPGNHIPGIPRHLGKVGFSYDITPRFKVGADTLLVGQQYFVGDDSNQNPKLPFYFVVNARASYQLTDHVQIFGLVNNLLNRHYATYGTYYETDTDARRVNATLQANDVPGGNAEAVTVAQPLSVYGGIKVSF